MPIRKNTIAPRSPLGYSGAVKTREEGPDMRKNRRISLKKAKSLLRDNASLMELAEALLEEGYDRKVVASLLAEAADDALDFSKIVPGPAGAALEAADYAVFHAAALLIIPVIERKVEQAREAVQERLDERVRPA